MLKVDHIDAFGQQDKLTLFSAMTCSAVKFEWPGNDAIAEHLVADPDGGAIAFWSMTGWSLNHLAEHLNQDFFTSLFEGKAERLGRCDVESPAGLWCQRARSVYARYHRPDWRPGLGGEKIG